MFQAEIAMSVKSCARAQESGLTFVAAPVDATASRERIIFTELTFVHIVHKIVRHEHRIRVRPRACAV